MNAAEPPRPSPELREARRLAEDRQWTTLLEHAAPLAAQAQLAEPELGYLYADALRRTGRIREALETGSRVEARVRRTGDHRLRLRAVNLLGMALFEAGEVGAAEERFRELLDYSAQWQDEEFAARAANNLGVLANVRGARDSALLHYERALAAYHRLGHVRGLAQTHHNLGISYRELGYPAEADQHYLRAIELGRRSRSEEVIGMAEVERALLRAQQGDGALAASMARRAERRFQRLGDPVRRADATRVLGVATHVQGDSEGALALLGGARDIALAHDNRFLRADVERDRGEVLRALGRLTEARAALLAAAAELDALGARHQAQRARGAADECAGEDAGPP